MKKKQTKKPVEISESINECMNALKRKSPPTGKPVKKSGSKAASVAGKYLEMNFEQLIDYLHPFPIKKLRTVFKDIQVLAASVLSQTEK